MSAALRSDVEAFIGGDHRTHVALLTISAAESLTDDLAEYLLADEFDEGWVAVFVDAVHRCDFVIERNSEWHLAPTVRTALHERLQESGSEAQRVHGMLFALAHAAGEGDHLELPRYLEDAVGETYHGTFTGGQDAARGYGAIAKRPRSGLQWLAARLATEQVEMGVLPPDQLEVVFLNGMLHLREGHWDLAEPFLRQVAESDEQRSEVALAAHLVGQRDVRSFARVDEGIRLLRHSVRVNTENGDRLHLGQVMHSLAQALLNGVGHETEAEDLLRDSIAIDAEHGGAGGWSLAKQTLGSLLGRRPGRADEGEDLLLENLEAAERQGDRIRVSQTLHLLGQLVGRAAGRNEQAERYLRRSLAMEAELGRKSELASVQHTLAQLISQDPSRRSEALELYQASLDFGRSARRLDHQAQVLRGMARVPGTPYDEALRWLNESLAINRRTRNAAGQRIVRADIAALERGDRRA
jgi:tetratricopeptide (TPR) repeat protein